MLGRLSSTFGPMAKSGDTMKVEFHFDFGSPNAYLSHAVIPQIEQRTGVTFEYVPVLLGGLFKLTNNQSPVMAYANIRNKMDYERREMARFIARHGIARFRFNPHFPVNTLLLMRGAVAAKRSGALPAYVDATFRAMWEDGGKMDDPEIVRATLKDAGLDPALIDQARDQAVKDELARNTERSVERGSFGVPTFFVDEEIYFGKNTLRDVEDEIRRRKAA